MQIPQPLHHSWLIKTLYFGCDAVLLLLFDIVAILRVESGDKSWHTGCLRFFL